jgi:hypothetical protein
LLIEQFLPPCILTGVNRLSQAIALSVLALWGLAAMHCQLEVLPGLDFLQSCCYADSSPSAPKHCESDGCDAVENGCYLAQEQNAAAPQPPLVPVLISPVIEAPLPDIPGQCFSDSKAPPDLSRFWQFSYRAALPPRAPTTVS